MHIAHSAQEAPEKAELHTLEQHKVFLLYCRVVETP